MGSKWTSTTMPAPKNQRGCVQTFSSRAMQVFFFFFISTDMPLLLILYASPWFPGWKTDLLAEELLVHKSPPDSCTLAVYLSA